jgi:hypothetical protein
LFASIWEPCVHHVAILLWVFLRPLRICVPIWCVLHCYFEMLWCYLYNFDITAWIHVMTMLQPYGRILRVGRGYTATIRWIQTLVRLDGGQGIEFPIRPANA